MIERIKILLHVRRPPFKLKILHLVKFNRKILVFTLFIRNNKNPPCAEARAVELQLQHFYNNYFIGLDFKFCLYLVILIHELVNTEGVQATFENSE